MTLTSFFDKRLDGRSVLKTALVLLKTDGTEEKYSWYDYRNKAIYIAEWLKRGGVQKGDFVAIIPLNLPESFSAMLGIILIGAVPVPINIHLLREKGLVDLRKIIGDCKPKFILINEFLREFILGTGISCTVTEEIIIESKVTLSKFGPPLTKYCEDYPTAKINDLLIMPYTSGTSGQPKGVMLTHENVINRLEAASSAFAITKNERILSYLPLGHIAELITTFFGQIYSGYTVYFTEYSKEILANRERFGKKFPSVLQQVQPTIFVAVPTIWTSFKNKVETKIKNTPVLEKMPRWLKKFIIKRKLFRHARVLISAGDKIDKKYWKFFANLGIYISDIYGQTETAGPLTVDGKVIGSNIKVDVNENGEITVVGDCVMARYYQNPSANAQAFTKNEAGEVVYHTGDTGIKDGEKIFWSGRIGDSGKMANGEFVTAERLYLLEEKIKKIDGDVEEVIVCFESKPHMTAMIFSKNYLDQNLKEKIRRELPKIGKGMYALRRFILINSAELELTPTMKVKRKMMLEKFASVIDSLYK